ncbi:MAG TPA: hypothetical protein VFV75_11125 [Candidatus Polarisedimenticolaceae bacterium]|nr:hypothetical protein [Candidatus Polarisedimenticolaceae bacterium]
MTEGTRERAFRLVLAAGTAAALAMRLLQAHALSTDLFAGVLVQDARLYWERALRLQTGVSFTNVGYPWFLAAWGRSIPAVLLVQALLGSAACAFVALAARVWTGRRAAGLVALAAALLAAPPLFYDGLLLTPSPTFACLAAALWLLGRDRLRPRAWTAAAVGACLTVPILLRANAVLFVPVAAAALLRQGRFRHALALSAGALALPLAAVLCVGITQGQWVPLSANAGMNLWVGNHHGATGVYVAAPFLQDGGAEAEERAFLDEARRRAGDPWMDLAHASAFWRRAALREVRVPLLLRKALLFFTNFEVKTNYSMAFMAARSRPLRLAPLGFGLLAALGCAGIALLLLTGRPGGGLLLGWVAVPWLTCVVFFVSGEYRHASTPALLLGLGALPVAALESRWPARACAAIVLALVATAAAWPRPELPVAFAPTLDVRAHVRNLLEPGPGEPVPGPPAFARALAMTAWQEDGLVVRDARLWVHVEAARRLGRREDARAALEEAGAILARDLRPRPGLPPESFLRYLFTDVPARMRTLASLPVVRGDAELSARARLLGGTGWADASLPELRRAVAAAPADPRPRAELGRALLLAGHRREGLAELRASCLSWPEIPQCALYVAEQYAREGNFAQARRSATLALARDPDYQPAARLLRSVDAPGVLGQTPAR